MIDKIEKNIVYHAVDVNGYSVREDDILAYPKNEVPNLYFKVEKVIDKNEVQARAHVFKEEHKDETERKTLHLEIQNLSIREKLQRKEEVKNFLKETENEKE